MVTDPSLMTDTERERWTKKFRKYVYLLGTAIPRQQAFGGYFHEKTDSDIDELKRALEAITRYNSQLISAQKRLNALKTALEVGLHEKGLDDLAKEIEKDAFQRWQDWEGYE